MSDADTSALVAMLRQIQCEPASFDTYSMASAAERAADAIERLRSSGGACDSPLAAGDAFVAAFKREPKDPADLAWMNGYAAGRRAPEPRGKPVPCWCPYCEQPHTPRIQEADPRPPTKPCSCQDTTESACGVAQGSVLGKLWHCRRSQLTKDGKL